MSRFVCIHGHFYQPPRDNPWLDEVQEEPSAAPYHDWNDRITAECYRPNAAARILEAGRIRDIVNNYERLSFNFGPTLLAWLERQAQAVYQAILRADVTSAKHFGGHGSAIAQGYNHIILPLANPRDRQTQVAWGCRDFEHRFGRRPEGMWLPETAVSTASLEALAAAGLKFTILAPHQARRWRQGDGSWRSAQDGLDIGQPHRVRLPSGADIAVFLYDGKVASAVAFEGLLEDGGRLASRLTGAPADTTGEPRLMHIATDGESYGHHHRFGEMALAFALDRLASNPSVELTNYGAYLARHPPRRELEIVENSSWSCSHGVERWRADCGCRGGELPGSSQAWRKPLRDALDWLRDALAPAFEAAGATLLHDPWEARNDYIEVILDRSATRRQGFLERHAKAGLGPAERTRAFTLLEMQRQAMLMFTSCGWFFDDVARIETIQVLRYADRAVHLAASALGVDLGPQLLQRLALARGNDPEFPDAAAVVQNAVMPTRVGFADVVAHAALGSLAGASSVATSSGFHGFELTADVTTTQREPGCLVHGRATVSSRTTEATAEFEFVAIDPGDYQPLAKVSPAGACDADTAPDFDLIQAAVEDGRWADARHLVAGRHGRAYTLDALLPDYRRRWVAARVEAAVTATAAAYREIDRDNAALFRLLERQGQAPPPALAVARDVIATTDLERLLEATPEDPARLAARWQQAQAHGAKPDLAGLSRAAGGAADRLAATIDADDGAGVLAAHALMTFADGMGMAVDSTRLQQAVLALARQPDRVQHLATDHPTLPQALTTLVRSLGLDLAVR